MDNIQKDTHGVSVMTDLYKGTCTVVEDDKDDRLLPHQIRRTRLTKGGGKSSKHQATEESSSDESSEILCRYKNCKNLAPN